eukprot:10925789-Alexandrium_andersonii.AAC.1
MEVRERGGPGGPTATGVCAHGQALESRRTRGCAHSLGSETKTQATVFTFRNPESRAARAE